MRCKTCNYRLWNLTERRCPECGTPFLPSEFEFAPQSVQFCCPHCNQGYYGTGAMGHLTPLAFECVRCHASIHMDQMVLRPTAGVEEEQTTVFKVPWVERGQRTQSRAWLATIGLALVSPFWLMRALPLDSPTRWAWGFALLTTAVIALIATAPFLLISLLALVGVIPRSGGYFSCAVVAMPLIAAAAMLAFTLLWGLVAHGLLALTGRTAGGIGRTYQALCYASGANVLSAVPCLGIYVGWIWWLISAVLMLKEGQRVHGGRAALAALTFPLLMLGTAIGLYLWFVFSMLATVPWAPQATAVQRTEAQTVLSAVLRYAGQNANRGPAHAAQLVVGGYVESSQLICTTSFTQESLIKVGGTPLDQFTLLPAYQTHASLQAAIDALPNETVAHRLGDYVFTYHGIDFSKVDPQMWVVIQWLDPGANPPTPYSQIVVGDAGGTLQTIPLSAFPSQLGQQNILRSQHGLPPLPNPATVTCTQPAVAGP